MQISACLWLPVLTKAPQRVYLHNCRGSDICCMSSTKKMTSFFFVFFYICPCPPSMLLVTFLDYFSKMMEFYRFDKHFGVSGDFLAAKNAWRRRPAHVRLEQGFLLFQHFLGSKKVFFPMFFFCLILKKQQFSLSQSHLWASTFSTVFFYIFDGISKMRVRGAPKILKNQLVL